MDMSNSQRINAPRATVWAAINDPEMLKKCIPGCEEIEQLSDTDMAAKVVLKIGPVKASFKGKVTFENVVAPETLTIVGEGSGGIAGHAKGSAEVKLEEDGDGTILSYQVKAQIGGKIAQLGSRLIDSTAQKLAKEFFTRFEAELTETSSAS